MSILKISLLSPITFLLVLAAQIYGQTPSPLPDTDVVRITSKIVQVDVVVVDNDGKPVPDLPASDFQMYQDGKPQKISGFSYVNKASKQVLSSAEKLGKNAALPPPVKLTAANAGRVITFIVDDGNCKYSTTGATASREAVQKFIREQMLPTDLVAIYQTRSGSSVFQQYTNDRARLLNLASRIQWRPSMGSCSSNNGSFFEAARSNTYLKRSVTGTTVGTIETEDARKAREHNEDQTNNNQVVGSLGVIRYVVKGLQRIPGRKVVFFLSDGLPLVDRSGQMLSAADVLRDLTDLSNRAGVVFNTIDSRGVFDEGMIEAADEVYAEGDTLATNRIRAERSKIVTNSRDGLAFIARETGGQFYQSQNYLDVPIKKALSTETGYYLIAYEPSEETFKGKKFNKIEVKVDRPGLRVVSRTGFVGVVTETAKPRARSENTPLYDAIVSPLPEPGLGVDLTAYFYNSAEQGDIVRSFFHLDAGDLKFTDESEGTKKAVIDVVAVTLNEKGNVVDEFTRTHTIRLDPASFAIVRQNGLVYSADVPIKQPGTYNFRVAIRDSAGALGSAGQIVEVPDLKKRRLFLSGLTVAQIDGQGKFALPNASSAASAFSIPGSTGEYAIRQFQRGQGLAYMFTIYDALLDKGSERPQITIQLNLFKDGKLIIEGTPQLTDFQIQSDWTRIKYFGRLRIGAEMEPGAYTMQVIANDNLADRKNALSSQSTDFTVTE